MNEQQQEHLIEDEFEQELDFDDGQNQQDLEIKYLSFYLSGQLYGISIAGVTEILQIQPTTPMPELPNYVKGIINLRGQVLPIIDVNLRFGKEERPYTDRTCIIIVSIDGAQAGFIVDEVEEVLTIENEKISLPPSFVSGEQGRYVTGIAKLESKMMLILDCRRILSESQLGSFGL